MDDKASDPKEDMTVDAPGETESDEDDEVIRCVCGGDEGDESGRIMIACDKCDVWQHNDCIGVTEDPDKQPESYYCEQCRPVNHSKLLKAMGKGEKPWEDAAGKKAQETAGKNGK